MTTPFHLGVDGLPPAENSPRIVLLSSGPVWHGAIRRELQRRGFDTKKSLIQAISFGDLEEETNASLGSVGVIHVSRQNLDLACRHVHSTSNNPYGSVYLSAAAPDLRMAEKQFREIGFADCFWSVIQVPRLVNHAIRITSTVNRQHQTIEQTVWANLPWKPTSEN